MNKAFPVGVQLESSSLDAVAYHPANHWLAVRFANGSGYVYQGVPESVWSQLLKAESHGGFFAKEIRDSYHATPEPVQFGKIVSLQEYLRGPVAEPFRVDLKEMKTMASTAWW